jgi:hypothetical protein
MRWFNLKLKILAGILAALLLLTGCRSPGDKQADKSAQPSAAVTDTYGATPGGGILPPGDGMTPGGETSQADASSPGGQTPQSEASQSEASPSGGAATAGSEAPASDGGLPTGDTAAPSAGEPDSPEAPASGGNDASTPGSDGMASKEETDAALEDILEQLGELDQLYSELDDIQDSDLEE